MYEAENSLFAEQALLSRIKPAAILARGTSKCGPKEPKRKRIAPVP